jgi:hypothetical protein
MALAKQVIVAQTLNKIKPGNPQVFQMKCFVNLIDVYKHYFLSLISLFSERAFEKELDIRPVPAEPISLAFGELPKFGRRP